MEIINKEDIEKRADIFMKSISEKIKEDIADKFYSEYSIYLDEHYSNYKEKIKREALDDLGNLYITGEKDIKDYGARDVRQKIYFEFKDEIQNQKIKDLEEENKRLQEKLDLYQESF